VPLSFGAGVHDFTLPNANGGQVTLSQYLGQKNIVLVFYRAFW
jgi:peroxiredoxin